MFTRFKYFLRRMLGETVYKTSGTSYKQCWGEIDRAVPSPSYGDTLNAEPMLLRIYSATGGTIVETSLVNRITDRSTQSLHIITDDKQLGNELAKIITMQLLRS